MNKANMEEEITDHLIKFKDSHYRLAYSYTKNPDDALDIVQESIYKAFSSMDSLKNISYIKTWFYRILVNTAIDFLRKRKRLVVVDDEVLVSLDAGKMDNYENIDLRLALENLPDNYRSIIILRYFEDLKLEEIAEVLNENVNTVKTRLYSGLKQLRIKMEDEKLEED